MAPPLSQAEVARALAPVPGLIQEIRNALSTSEREMGPQTWQSSSADHWYGDWRQRRKVIESMLQVVEDERARLLNEVGKRK
jgi:hypothetical protein